MVGEAPAVGHFGVMKPQVSHQDQDLHHAGQKRLRFLSPPAIYDDLVKNAVGAMV